MSDIEACRTCGIFFLVKSNFLRHLFDHDPEISFVRRELEAWNINLNQNQQYPQYICTVCLLEFRKILKFQQSCLETQDQLRQLYEFQQDNIKKMKIKTEIPDDEICDKELEYADIGNSGDNGEQNSCAFIYVDDLSDSEYDNHNENNKSRSIEKFKVPHIPIKEEIIEEARVPLEEVEEKNDEYQKVEEMSLLALTESQMPVTISGAIEGFKEQESGIQCELCMHVLEDQQDYRQHLLRIHEAKLLTCHICGKDFKTPSRLKYHLKWHRINKSIKCPLCGFHCASRNVLNEHKQAVHNKIPCEICGKRLFPKKMRLHLEEHQESNRVSPAKQIESPYFLNGLTNDIDRDQDQDQDQHVLLSNRQETEENENISPLNQHNTEGNIIESVLDFEKASSSGMTSTSTSINTPPNDMSEVDLGLPLYSIEFESNYFNESNGSYETSLQNEMSTVNLTESGLDEMQFTCAQCPMTFAKVDQLVAHAESHEDKSLFCCNICGKNFDLKFSLNRHMKRHKNVTC